MKVGYIRRIFPGGNTSKGYMSFFDNVIFWAHARKIFVLKGGPGAGKSNIIKKIGENIAKNGIDIEFLHCTADNNSLDGVVIPQYGIAIIDGTAPHMTDPKYPGCVDEIINLGELWDENGIRKHKRDIIKLREEISRCYKKGYGYLKTAKNIYDEMQEMYSWVTDEAKMRRITEEIIDQIFRDVTIKEKKTKQRHMFASAITSGGLMNFLENIFEKVEKRFILKGDAALPRIYLLNAVLNIALMKGFDVEVFHCPLSPEKVEHLIIKDLNIGFITSVEPHVFNGEKTGDLVIDFDEVLVKSDLNNYREDIEFSKMILEQVLNKAVDCFREAKVLHGKLESIYTTNMDFKKVDQKTEYIYETILSLINTSE